jgi:hypothetical protein
MIMMMMVVMMMMMMMVPLHKDRTVDGIHLVGI